MRISDWSSDVCSSDLIELVISAVADPDAFGAAYVELRLLNSGSASETMTLPPQIAAELTINGGTGNITLERAPQTPEAVSVPAGGFIRARYRSEARRVGKECVRTCRDRW